MAVQFAPGPLGAALASKGGGPDPNDKLTQIWAQLMLKNATGTEPIQSHWQGADKLAQAAMAGMLIAKERANEKDSLNTMGSLVFPKADQGKGRSPTLSPVPDIAIPQAPSSPGLSGGLPFGLGKIFGGGEAAAPAPAAPAPMPPPMPSPMPPIGGTDGAALPMAGPQMAMAQAVPPPMSGDVKPLPMPQPEMAMPSGPVVPSQIPMPQARPQPGAPSPQMLASILSPQLSANQPAPLTGGNPQQGIDRSRIAQELQANPQLINRLADMVNGEVTMRDPKLAQIQTESAADRALARNIPLAQALKAVNQGPGGYYASDTYSRPANQQQLADFQQNILPKVLQGSEVGKETLGFRPTGNASQLGFAQRRADQGMYDASKWYSGKPGVGEMYATEKGDTARMAKNLRSNFPAELLSPNSDAERAMSFAPTQVASSDNLAGIPAGPQAPGIGSFTPGALPNVQNVNVRPTGPQAAMPTPQQPPMPQQPPQMAQAGQPQAPQIGGQAPQPAQTDPRAAMQSQLGQYQAAYQDAMRRGNTSLAKQILGAAQDLRNKLLTTEQFKPLYDKNGNPYGQQSSLTNKVDSFPQPPGAADTQVVQYARQNWQQLGLPDPGSPDPKNQAFWKEFVSKRLGGAGVNVSIDQSAPNEFEKEYGQGMGKRALNVIESGDKAADDVQNVRMLKGVLSGIQTGKLTPTGANMGAWLQSVGIDPGRFGIDPSMPATAEAATAMINKFALSNIGAQSGGIPANNFSEADRDFIVKTVASLSNRPEANNLLLDVKERQASLAMERANKWADARANGTSYEKFESQWRKDLQGRNVFGDLAQQAQALSGGRQQPSQAPAVQPSRDQIEQELRRRGVLK